MNLRKEVNDDLDRLREIEEAYEGAIDDTYGLLEMGGVDISALNPDDEELIDQIIAEMAKG